MPWREQASPYRTWISEIMLQQTQVQSVIPYFNRFVSRFPDARSLARAKESEVLRLWTGLGYYSRARNLHRAAQAMVAEHGGRVPDSRESLLRLPGIGPYSAGAILSIAFDKPVPILDGNVRRVLSRFFLEKENAALWDLSLDIVTAAAGSRVPPSEFNQALMEVGALVCFPQAPDCGVCPLRKDCGARRKNLQDLYPPALPKPKTLRQFFALLALRRGGRFLVQKRSDRRDWLKNVWCFPLIERPPRKAPASLRVLAADFKKETGLPALLTALRGKIRHSVTRYAIAMEVYEGRASDVRLPPDFRWMTIEELRAASWSSLTRKALALLD